MSKYILGNQKHLTLDDRIYTENKICKGTSFKDLARFLCKDPTTISKEVKVHCLSEWYHKSSFYNTRNFCIHRYHCTIAHKYRHNARFADRKIVNLLPDPNKEKTIAFPDDSLNLASTGTTKEKKVSCLKRIKIKLLFHQCCQTIDPFSEI